MSSPARLTKAEVLGLARYGPKTPRRRIVAGVMPEALDRNGDGALFDRAPVLSAGSVLIGIRVRA